MKPPLEGRTLILGVTGGIAAYKAAELVRGLKELGADVHVVMTEAAVRFITPLTLGALSGNPVRTGLFDEAHAGVISHIELTADAGLVVVAPATANIIGKAAAGIADDLLSTMLLAAKCPVILAPAMNCRMYENPVVRRNIETLKALGYRFVGPEMGRMACNEYGWGRMSEPDAITAEAVRLMAAATALAGKKFLVTAGPTFEDMDPVRFIGNRSSGRMGFEVAAEAAARGADVTLVHGPVSLAPPSGVKAVPVRSAAQMRDAVMKAAKGADVVVMAAAVSDYAPETTSKKKIKKTDDQLTIRLVRTPDILAELGRKKPKGLMLVGFAAETEDLEKNALRKLREKGLDLIAANPVGGDTGFGSEHNVLRIYGREGLIKDTGRVTKREAAGTLLDIILKKAGFKG